MCGYIAGNKVVLQKHIDVKHSNDRKDVKQINCYECDYEVESKERLKQHMKTKHGITQEFKCSECDLKLYEKSELEKHIAMKHTERKCSLCDYIVINQAMLDKHLEFKHNNSKKNCFDCDKEFESRGQLKMHMENEHAMVQLRSMSILSKVIECRICSKTFQDKRDFMLHRKSNHIEVVAFCQKESERKCIFSSNKCWWKHREKDDQDKNSTIKCFICQTMFSSKDAMMMHRKNMHRNVVKECSKLKNSECNFGESGCWFRHGTDDTHEEDHDQINKNLEEDVSEQSVFQNVLKTSQVK